MKAATVLSKINDKTNMGDLRKIAKDIKMDHDLAMELWAAGKLLPRLLAILVMDNKRLSEDLIDTLEKDIQAHPINERNQLMDWLMANQLLKNKKIIPLVESWEKSNSPLKRRIFWYHQARLRWMGQTPPANSPELVTKIEATIAKEAPEVQWAMNLTAGWIGVYEKQYRKRCVAIGENTGLFKGEKVSKGCTPNYLPEFIAIETKKRNL